MLSLLAKILEAKYRDTFLARLGSTLLLGKLGVVGAGSKILAPLISGFIGLMMESGVFQIDLTIDAYKEGQKLDEFKKAAKEAYDHARAKVYSEQEKQKIREQYLAIISKFASV